MLSPTTEVVQCRADIACITSRLSTGAAVTVTGKWQSSRGKEQAHELQAHEVRVQGQNDSTVLHPRHNVSSSELKPDMAWKYIDLPVAEEVPHT